MLVVAMHSQDEAAGSGNIDLEAANSDAAGNPKHSHVSPIGGGATAFEQSAQHSMLFESSPAAFALKGGGRRVREHRSGGSSLRDYASLPKHCLSCKHLLSVELWSKQVAGRPGETSV